MYCSEEEIIIVQRKKPQGGNPGCVVGGPGALTLVTVMLIIKLNLFPVPVRFRSGSGKLKIHSFFTMFGDI